MLEAAREARHDDCIVCNMTMQAVALLERWIVAMVWPGASCPEENP